MFEGLSLGWTIQVLIASKGIETIQIEVNRSLYMDENKLLLKNIEPIQKIFSDIFNFFSYNFKIAAE